MRVPAGASLQVLHVSGDARIKLVRGALTVGKVSGDLGLQGVGAATIDSVSGDLTARSVQGDLAVGRVSGDCAARDVEGAFSVEVVNGDLRFSAVSGNVSATSHGDISAGLSPAAGRQIQLSAYGDLSARVPPGASARINMVSAGQEIRVRVPGVSNAIGKGAHQVILGAGEAEVNLSAKGSIALVSDEFAAPPEDFGVRLDVEFARMGETISRRSQEMADRIARQAESKAQAAAQRAARKAERMADRMAREAERQTRIWTNPRRGPRFDFPFGPPAPGVPRGAPPAQPVTDEERLSVLRMVEQKKITVEQAEQLLAALEGRSS